MSINLVCFARLKLYNSKGVFVKDDFVHIPVLQTPTAVTTAILQNPSVEYFKWVREAYKNDSSFAERHCKRIRKLINNLQKVGYEITWGSQ